VNRSGSSTASEQVRRAHRVNFSRVMYDSVNNVEPRARTILLPFPIASTVRDYMFSSRHYFVLYPYKFQPILFSLVIFKLKFRSFFLVICLKRIIANVRLRAYTWVVGGFNDSYRFKSSDCKFLVLNGRSAIPIKVMLVSGNHDLIILSVTALFVGYENARSIARITSVVIASTWAIH